MKRRFFVPTILALCLLLVSAAGGLVSAQSGNMWHVDYYPNTDWSGNPVYSQDVPMLWFDWGYGAPGPNMPSTNWTNRGTSTVFFYSGTYRFQILVDDDVFFQIDNVTYLDTRGAGQSGKTFTFDVPLGQGNHYVRADYRQWSAAAYEYITWTYLGSGGNVPPPTPPPPSGNTSGYPTIPNSATSVQTQYGDYTPCIQNNQHQSACFVPNGQYNSPNTGSIAMEPKIEIWGNCTGDQVQTFWVPSLNNTKQYKCSKTEAGWFPN
jgi:hypothetical protein